MYEFNNPPPNNPMDKAAWQNKQRQIFLSKVNDPARKAQLQKELMEHVRLVAYELHGKMLPPPHEAPKSEEGVQTKVDQEYGGNAIEIKDVVRCTLVVESHAVVPVAMAKLKAYFAPGRGTNINGENFTVFEEKIVDGTKDKAGYSGWTVFVTKAGYKGEIQVNTKEIMYAKTLDEFKKQFPNDYELFLNKYPAVPGGIGHELYEVARAKETPQARRDAFNAASRAYYAYFRSDPPDFVLGERALSELVALGLIKDLSYIKTEPLRIADELAKLPRLSDIGQKPAKPPRRPLPPGYISMMSKPEKPPRSDTLPPGFVDSFETRPRR